MFMKLETESGSAGTWSVTVDEPGVGELDVARRSLAVAPAQNAAAEDRFVKSQRTLDVGNGEKMCDGDAFLRRHLIAFLPNLYFAHERLSLGNDEQNSVKAATVPQQACDALVFWACSRCRRDSTRLPISAAMLRHRRAFQNQHVAQRKLIGDGARKRPRRVAARIGMDDLPLALQLRQAMQMKMDRQPQHLPDFRVVEGAIRRKGMSGTHENI
jgi:hypothetical protein